MAGGKVKKGFTIYLVILILLIVAAFLTVVTVMLFSPFKTILGYKYFIYSEENYIYDQQSSKNKQTESENVFDFSTLNEININCSYAQVNIIRFAKVDNNAVRLTNKASGFAKDGQDTDFVYNVYFSDTNKRVLNIDVKEPTGFIYFSKNIQVDLLIPSSKTSSLSNVAVNIENTSGNISIGNNEALKSGNSDIKIKSLNIKTSSADVDINKMFDSNISSLFIKSNGGNVSSNVDIKAENFDLYSKSGRISLKDITLSSSKELNLDLGTSKFSSNTINANINIVMKDGYFDVNEINGYLSSNNSINQMGSATMHIKSIKGNISLPYANSSKITVDKMGEGNQAYVNGTSGKVDIKELHGEAWIYQTSGSVTLDTYSNDVSVKTTSGKIDVSYKNQSIANELNLESTSGEINLKVRGDLAFIAKFVDTNGKDRTQDKISIEFYKGFFVNPLTINAGTKYINFVSNANINISLLEG